MIKYLAPRMESLLHSTDDRGYNVVNWAAQKGHADVVKLVVEQYNLDPAARDKVRCTLRCPVKYIVCSRCGLYDESAHM